MKMFFLFLLVIISIELKAEVEKKPDATGTDNELLLKKMNYQINNKYKAGMFLIYDCKGEYYACVDGDGNENCRESRDASIAKKDGRYPCAPLKKYENVQECLVKNYEVIESLALKRFCFPK